jgi:four helix bundle protein
MTEIELKSRTKSFAHNCVKFVSGLPSSTLGYHIQKQLIRCSTSVAANYRAACVAQSTNSFIAKLSIVIEEIDESSFWLEFIQDEKVAQSNVVEVLLKEANELTAIFVASRKTLQKSALKN